MFLEKNPQIIDSVFDIRILWFGKVAKSMLVITNIQLQQSN